MSCDHSTTILAASTTGLQVSRLWWISSRIRSGVLASGSASRARFGISKSLRDRLRYFPGDLLRRAGRRRYRHPGIGIDAGQRLRNGGDPRVILERLAAAGGEQFELARVDVRLVGEEIIRHQIDVSGEQVVDGGGAAAIGNFRHAEVALEHQQLAEQVSRLALALVSVIDLAGIGTRVGG